MIVISDDRCTGYHLHGHPERPQRVARTKKLLEEQTLMEIVWDAPAKVTLAQIRRAHSDALLERLTQLLDFDQDTPAHPDIREHAERSVGAALRALDLAAERKHAFSLLRPPGHHATRDKAMGFCYLNSVAIAALEALARGVARIAVFDFDVHHGNGTEDILAEESRAAFFSVHQFPAYPGSGAESRGNIHNYPVGPGSPRGYYQAQLEQALEDIRLFKPAMVAVSAGFDAYSDDPLSDAPLETDDFFWLGKQIRELGVPSFSLLEGGYSHELPHLIFAYLRGLEGLDA